MTDDTLPGLSVLVVEDDEDTAASTAQLLTLYGHRVTVARTGGAALDRATADPPDVILLDIGLPGMSGWEVARRLRQRERGKPAFVVALTGYGRDDDRRRSNLAGVDLHLVKPVEPGVLVGLLDRFQAVIARPVGPRPRPARHSGRCG